MFVTRHRSVTLWGITVALSLTVRSVHVLVRYARAKIQASAPVLRPGAGRYRQVMILGHLAAQRLDDHSTLPVFRSAVFRGRKCNELTRSALA